MLWIGHLRRSNPTASRPLLLALFAIATAGSLLAAQNDAPDWAANPAAGGVAQGQGMPGVSAGHVKRPIVGDVGQRQTRSQAAGGVEPLLRLDDRVANRVQSRIRNRIDRYYDPQANAASPFTVAADQARKGAGRRH